MDFPTGMHMTFNDAGILRRWPALAEQASPSRLRYAVKLGIDRTLVHLRKIIAVGIRETYHIKSAAVKNAVIMRKPVNRKGAELAGSLTYVSRLSLPLISYGAKQRKKGVSVRILKTHGTRLVTPGGDKKIMKTAKDRAAVWIAKGHVMARVEDKDHPVILYGPSLLSYFTRPGIWKMLRVEAYEFMHQRVEHETEAVLAGFGSGGKHSGKTRRAMMSGGPDA
ncbi:MAG: hypothetical protein LBQ51_05695 [Desulfovibrio sp.]|jgi:hypothetical protein|nr:hypothetical protein [Desulfovibrio sp.]